MSEHTEEQIKEVERLKKRVNELEASEQRFRAMLHGIGDGLIATDARSRVLQMNPVAEQLTGWTMAEAVGQPLDEVFQIIDDKTRRPLEGLARRIIDQGSVVRLSDQTILLSKDGREIPITDSGAPVFDSQGNVTGMVLVFRDQAEERLTQRLIQLRLSLIEYAADHTLHQLLTRALDEVGTVVDSPIGFYHFVEPDQPVIALQEWSTRTKAEFCQAEGHGRHYDLAEAGVWVDCVYQKQPVVHNDYASLPHKKGMPEGHAEVIRELVVPVMREDKVVAILGVGNKPTEYTDRDVNIVSYLADVTWEIVRQKRAEEALRESEERYRSLVERSHDGIIIIDDAYRFTYVNDEFCRIMGYPEDELVGRDFREFLTEEGKRITGENYRRRRTGEGAPGRYEFDIVRKSGEVRRVETSSTLIRDAQGRTRTFAQMLDITERKRAEEALRESEAKYRSLADNLPVGIFRTTPGLEGSYLYANRAMVRMLGFDSAEELMQTAVADSYADPAERRAFSERLILAGNVSNHEMLLKKRDGSHFWSSITAEAFRGEWGSIEYFEGIVENITERKQAEEALLTSEERYRHLVEESFDGIFIQKGTMIVFANQQLSKMLGYEPGELEGRDHWVVYHPDSRELTRSRAQARLRGEFVPPRYEVKLQRKDGTSLDGEVSARAFTVDGEPGIQVWVRDISERKRAEQELRESEERYRTLVDKSHAGINIIDDAYRFIYVNEEFCRIFGYSEEELVGRDFRAFMSEDSKSKVKEYYRKRQRGEEAPPEYEFDIVRKSGEVRHVETRSSAIRDAQGRMITFAQMLDITERKRAEQELRESEERYRNLVEKSHAGILIVDEAYHLVYVNAEFCSILGYPEEELIGQDFRRFLSEDSKAIVAEYYRKRQMGEEPPTRYEFDIIRRNGEVRRVETSSSVIRDATGRQQTFAQLLDITERKRNEEEIIKEQNLSKVMIDSVPGIFYLFDQEGRFLRWNDSLEAVSGYTTEEISRLHPLDLFRGADREMIADRIRKVFETGQADAEAEIVGKDDRATPHYVTGRRIEFDGRPCIIGVGIDVTERKRLEEQLRQSQKMEAIGRLAGGVAHDFNNILAVIMGYSQLVLDRLEHDDPFREDLEAIDHASERAASLIRQLLAFSRKQILQPKSLELNRLVAGTERMLRRLIGEEIELVTFLDPDLGRIEADPGQIEQVIINLAVNARDAINGIGKLTIETADVYLDEAYCQEHADTSPGRHVMLSLTDTGEGMDEETKSKIFDPFFTTKDLEKGTGLGLATVYGIVKQSGGNIYVYSEPGQGTTFKIYLPVVDAEDTAPPPRPSAESFPPGTETVLVVEDEEVVRKFIVDALSYGGYTVIEAANGEQALDECRQCQAPIHILITDVVMPRMSGRELADRLTAMRPETKVLFMSGYTDNAIVHHGILDQGVNFIAKPFSPSALARKMREVLDQPD